MIHLFVVYQSGTISLLTDVSLDQAGSMVQRYPNIHIFYTENGET